MDMIYIYNVILYTVLYIILYHIILYYIILYYIILYYSILYYIINYIYTFNQQKTGTHSHCSPIEFNQLDVFKNRYTKSLSSNTKNGAYHGKQNWPAQLCPGPPEALFVSEQVCTVNHGKGATYAFPTVPSGGNLHQQIPNHVWNVDPKKTSRKIHQEFLHQHLFKIWSGSTLW